MRVWWTSGILLTVVLAQENTRSIPELVDSRHCLLQTDTNKLLQRETVDAAAAQSEVAHQRTDERLHARKAHLEATATNAHSEQNAESETAHRPDGPALMNRTLMSEKTLPEGSRHVNMKTFVTDWRDEYLQPPDAPDISASSIMSGLPKQVLNGSTSKSAVIGFLIAVVSLYCCSCVWSHTDFHH
mmetsp:Transcript_45560/g.105662  ORF Transcript_45560/g.105662 Transcript_45560/m.105662 type:complete len:186 (-) Transcript_45560:68-625(-)